MLFDWRNSYIKVKEQVRGSLNKFPDFYRMDTFIDITLMEL